MKRFPFVLLAVSVAAMTACPGKGTTPNEATAATGATGATGEQATSAAVAALAPGHVTVHVFCPGDPGGAGLKVLPWKVHAEAQTQVTWNVPNATRMDSVVATKVAGKPWPFQDSIYVLKTAGNTTAALADTAKVDVSYRYKLTAVCGVDTMVIDPDVIVDPTSSKDTTK